MVYKNPFKTPWKLWCLWGSCLCRKYSSKLFEERCGLTLCRFIQRAVGLLLKAIARKICKVDFFPKYSLSRYRTASGS